MDDYRTCPEGFVLVRNAEECLLLLQECDVDVLSLDYGLGWGQPNGMDVVGGIIASNRYPKRIYLHTSSDSGRQHMFQALYASKPEQVLLVNGPMPSALLTGIAENVKE
nr:MULTISPECIES: cyclic-phosphate processing receiver domain-containing protein [unclassified Paenibacillus]